MDLNELLARHQIALIDADHARTAQVREAAAALADCCALRISAIQPGLIGQGAVASQA